MWQSSPFITHNKKNTFQKLEKKECSLQCIQLLKKRKWRKKFEEKNVCVHECYLKPKLRPNIILVGKKDSSARKKYEMSIYLIICFLFICIVACQLSVVGCLYDFDVFFALSSEAYKRIAYSPEKFIEIPFISISIGSLLMLCSKSFDCTSFNTFHNLNS